MKAVNVFQRRAVSCCRIHQTVAYKIVWVLHFIFLGIWLTRWIVDGFTLRNAMEQYRNGGNVSWEWWVWLLAVGLGVLFSSIGMGVFLKNRMKPGCKPNEKKDQW